jgi:hypothetical protein
MTATGLVRIGLQLVSIATAAMAVWLVWVVLFVLPSRDPGHVQVWAIVAVASGALVVVSLLATRRGGPMVLALLALCSVVAVAFGLLVTVSFLTTVASGDPEGYLSMIGFVLTVHGTLGLLWTGIAALGPRSALTSTRHGR